MRKEVEEVKRDDTAVQLYQRKYLEVKSEKESLEQQNRVNNERLETQQKSLEGNATVIASQQSEIEQLKVQIQLLQQSKDEFTHKLSQALAKLKIDE